VKHCLVVDDSRVTREVARRILEDLAFETAEANDAESALLACRTRMPDAILLNAPQPGGTAFLKRLRRERNGSHPVIVLCTTQNNVTCIEAGISAGANDYLMKPFDQDVLHEKLVQAGLI
jgi:two-component system chemotaxis response regulator CheY